MRPIKYVVCRAVGLMGWVLECQYADGRHLLDLDVQARTWQAVISMATAVRRRDCNTTAPIKVEADAFWLRR